MTLEQGTCFRLYTCELLFVSLFFFPECSGILEDHTDPQMSCGDEIGPFYPNFPISAAHSGPVLSWKPVLSWLTLSALNLLCNHSDWHRLLTTSQSRVLARRWEAMVKKKVSKVRQTWLESCFCQFLSSVTGGQAPNVPRLWFLICKGWKERLLLDRSLRPLWGSVCDPRGAPIQHPAQRKHPIPPTHAPHITSHSLGPRTAAI